MNDLHGVAALAEGVDLSGIEQLKELPKLLFQVLSEARQAADLICPEVPGQLEHQSEAQAT